MESKQKSQNSSDELDLISLLEKAILFVKRFWKPIFLFTFLGLALALTSYFFSPRTYASRMLLQTRVLTNREHMEILETWNELLKKNQHQALASITGAELSLIKKLKKIKADEIQKLYIQNNPNGYYIDVLVTDTAALAPLGNAIVAGLENTSYIREKVESKKEWFRDMISNIQTEITKLESTKAVVDSLIRNKNHSASPLMVDISSLNGQWIGLNEKMLSFREELRFTRGVQVLQPFTASAIPESPKLLRSLFFGLAAGAFLGYLAALFLYVSQRINFRTRLRRAHTYEKAD